MSQDAVEEWQPPQTVDQGNFVNDEDLSVKLPDDLPEPTLWRILVMPVQPKRMSKGGLVMPEQTIDAESTLNYIGKVVKCGPLVGRSPKYHDGNGFSQYQIEPGQWVIYGRYAGQRLEYKGLRFLVVNDDEIICRIPNPDGFRVYI